MHGCNGHPGTLSLRHLHRLASGQRTGRPAHPATRRLLEAIFELPWAVLLAEPAGNHAPEETDEARRLSLQLRTAQRLDPEAVRLLADQIDIIRRLDRRFGAPGLLNQLRQPATHVHELLTYTVPPCAAPWQRS